MLVQFSFSNFKSFKDETVLNLMATNSSKNGFYAHKVAPNLSVLKTTAVYGANASGKTKLFDAFDFMKQFVCPPKRDNRIPVLDYWQTKYDAFRLSTHSVEENSFFEAVFFIESVQYRYGFELNGQEVEEEWLYLKKQREVNVFSRGKDVSSLKFNKEHLNAKIINNIVSADMVSPTSSLLVVLSTFNEPLASKIVNWFNGVLVISANDIRSALRTHPISVLADEERKNQVVEFMKAFDLNIEDLSLHEIEVSDIPEKIRAIIGDDDIKGTFYDGVRTLHKKYNELYEKTDSVWFSLERDESYGTNRLLGLSWAILSSLKNGTVLFIDEFDSGIHPMIARMIVELYYRCRSKAQLIINTQNASMLNYKNEDGKKLFTKNQIYLVDKNRYGESSLTPLTDFSNDFRSNIESIYLEGEVGGVPYINLDRVLNLLK